MSYCIYLRKSRADAELERLGEGETLARHKRTLTELAQKRGYEIGEVYEEIVSGETIAARPKMQALLTDVERGAWSGVLVMELERLARGNSIDQGIVAQTFKLTNTLIITPNKVFDPSNEFDEEYFEFGLFMSRREYKTINRRLQAGRIASVKEGNYIGTWAPFGYEKVRLEHGKGFTLRPNDEAPYVRMIFDWYVNENLTVIKIADRLTAMGVKPKKGGAYFSAATVREILRNMIYIGKVTWNGRVQKKTVTDGKVKVSRPRSDPADMIITDGKHEAIVSEDLFAAAQEKTGHTPRVRKNDSLTNPFAHIIVCKSCGRRMIYRPHKNSSDMLICPNKYCDVSGAPFETVERSILELLGKELGKLKTARAEKKNADDDIAVQITRYKNELTTLGGQQDRLYDLLEQGIYTAEIFSSRQNALKEKRGKIEKELSLLRRKQDQPQNYDNAINTISQFLESYDTLSPDEKNALLRSCTDYITYYREHSDRYHQKPVVLELTLKL